MYIKMEYIQKELANKIEQNHIINESGDPVTFAGERKVICEYENGLIR